MLIIILSIQSITYSVYLFLELVFSNVIVEGICHSSTPEVPYPLQQLPYQYQYNNLQSFQPVRNCTEDLHTNCSNVTFCYSVTNAFKYFEEFYGLKHGLGCYCVFGGFGIHDH